MQNQSYITLVNPHARINKRNPEYMQFLIKMAKKYGPCYVTQSLEEARDVCEQAVNDGVKNIGIVGGDGSISTVLGFLSQACGDKPHPHVLILRGGTMNVLAENLGISGKPHEVLEDYFKNSMELSKLKSVSIKSIVIKNKDEKLGFLFADGFAVRFLDHFYKRKGGPLKAGMMAGSIAVKGFFGKSRSFSRIFKPSRLKAKVNTSSQILNYDQNIGSVFISTYAKLPLNVAFFKTKWSDPFLEMCIVKKSGFGVIPISVKTVLGVAEQESEMERLKISKVELEYPDEPMQYTLDGEIFDYPAKGALKISVGPRFSFLVPGYKSE